MNWTIHAMRSMDEGDPLGGLGPRVEKAPETKPAAPEPVGVYTDAEGKMRTNLPLPEAPESPVRPFPSKPAIDSLSDEDDDSGGISDTAVAACAPLKVGDKVRLLGGGGIPDSQRGEFVVAEADDTILIHGQGIWADGFWCLEREWEGEVWERIAPPAPSKPEPLRVDSGGAEHYTEDEGRHWERA